MVRCAFAEVNIDNCISLPTTTTTRRPTNDQRRQSTGKSADQPPQQPTESHAFYDSYDHSTQHYNFPLYIFNRYRLRPHTFPAPCTTCDKNTQNPKHHHRRASHAIRLITEATTSQ
ncbi:hypothetical protein CGCF413_v006279 [Colletotrichum fructicola]|nr:hypothetical protein CGCF413_v006279 [Colletotrichum fructicola]